MSGTNSAAQNKPRLSIVAASRNDDHGGNLRGRMQHFVEALHAQCERWHLSAELILVEWNPPADRAPLREVLRWPVPSAWFLPRIITVPGAIHQRYQLAQRLPLYQMIAKNAGIRRARGKFVLATNIDILLNDELVKFLAAEKLRANTMYRADRWDVPAEIPQGPVAERLEWCAGHVLRVHRRNYTLDCRTGKHHRIYWRWTPGVLLLESLQKLGMIPVVTRDRLHVNGCGDFTLLARAAWERLRGYPELDTFSMHLDALFCHAAYRAGLRECVLPGAMRAYHIEHAIGSGWTPQGHEALQQRLATAGIHQVSLPQYYAWAVQMRRDRKPLEFNSPRWGLGEDDLPEENPTA